MKQRVSPSAVWALANELKGTPWKHEGKDKSGMDCLGVLIYFFKRLGIDLIGEDTQGYDINFWRIGKKDLFEEGARKRGLTVSKRASDALPGDILYFKFRKIVSHAAIYVGRGYFLHAVTNEGVVLEKLSDKLWGNRFYAVIKI